MKIQTPNSNISDDPDEATRRWEDDLDKKKHENLLDYRKQYVEFAIGVTQAWIGLLFIVVMCQLTLKKIGVCLETKEFMIVFGGSTIAIFSYAAILGKFLFPRDGFTNDWGKMIGSQNSKTP